MKYSDSYCPINLDEPARIHKKRPNVVIFSIFEDGDDRKKEVTYWMITPNPEFAGWIVETWNDQRPQEMTTALDGIRQATDVLVRAVENINFQQEQRKKYG